MKENPVALVCPLDWGIGHATRCVPVIKALIGSGFQVAIAGHGPSMEFLKTEFPGLSFHEFKGTRITYTPGRRLGLRIVALTPALLAGVFRERRRVKDLVRRTGASLIVADNRYGCRDPKAVSVFITHQLEIQVPRGWSLVKKPLNFLNRWFIKRFDECWVPDFELHRGLAGSLSHPRQLPGNEKYIGILSRFADRNPDPTEILNRRFDLLVMLSGPEPQRSVLEEKILHQLVSLEMQVAFLRGRPGTEEAYVLDGRIHVFSHLPTPRLQQVIGHADLIICRSGYSSIMDLVTLGRNAILIPTPGQPEQEYLAKYLMDKKIYFSMPQDSFDLLYALEMSKNFHGMLIRNDHKDLMERIREIGKRLRSGQ